MSEAEYVERLEATNRQVVEANKHMQSAMQTLYRSHSILYQTLITMVGQKLLTPPGEAVLRGALEANSALLEQVGDEVKRAAKVLESQE